jgi:HEPN domain-containing protein
MPKTTDSIKNWVESSNYDIKTAEHMFETKRYVYVLFMCHLATEKLLKALFEAAIKKPAPKTHNLIQLVSEAGLIASEDHLKTLSSLNDLSVVTRYPEDMKALVKAFKRDRVHEYLMKTKGLLKWLKQDKRLKK